MKSFANVKKLFMYDYNNYPEDNGVKDIELCVSSDYDVHFSNEKYFTDDRYDNSMKKGILTLTHYHGKVYLPKFTALEITDTERTVVGIAASPMHINNSGTLDLIIEKNSGLTLCIKNFEMVAINNVKLYESYIHTDELCDELKDYIEQYTGEPFDYYKEKYHDIIMQNDTSKIENTSYGKHIEKLGKFHIENINICRYHDLVYINKYNGISSIKYDLPTNEIIKTRKEEKADYMHYVALMKEKDVEKYFMNRIRYAKRPEDFNKIMADMKEKHDAALKNEDFENAVKLRDSGKLLKNILDNISNEKTIKLLK